MQEAPRWYEDWRATVDIDIVEYGVGGIQLFRANEVPPGQHGFSVMEDGESLVGDGPGDWRAEWVVIGHETACGDPIFASEIAPHAVFSAMHGEGAWDATLVAPSLDTFSKCLRAFQRFASGRNSPVGVETMPPTRDEQSEFLALVRNLTSGDEDALGFWAVQVELDLDTFERSA